MHRIAAGLFGLVLVVAASEAWAHAKLLQSTPAKGGAVAPPTEIRLKFDEPVETKLSGLELSTKTGEKVATGALAEDAADKATLVVPISGTLKPGAYKVHWHVVSDDMHKVEGDFTFIVKE